MTNIDPSKASGDYTAQSGFWAMVDDIMGGAEAMRAAGVKYLPRFESEDDKEYQARLVAAPWTPLYADSFRNLASKPFSKEVAVEGGAARFTELAENINASGDHLHVFSREVFKAGINYGIDWIWIGHVPVPQGATRQAARELRARPYWRRIPAKRVLAVYSDTVQGEEILTHVRIEENHVIREGFKETAVKQVRVIDRPALETGGYGAPAFQVWRKVQAEAASKEDWVVVEEGEISIGVIPMVPFITGEREGRSWRVQPPLKDLAYMQTTLFQMEANKAVVQMNTAFPVNVMRGVSKKEVGEGKIKFGPRTVLFFPPVGETGQFGDFHREEPSGTAATSLREDISAHKREMREAGMQPLVPATGSLTATATAVSEAKAHSAVQAWAIGLKDALEQAFMITAMWLDESDVPQVRVHTDFGLTGKDVEELRVLLEMNNPEHKLISDEAVIVEAQRRGLLGPEFDRTVDRDRIMDEIPGGMNDLEEGGALLGETASSEEGEAATA